MYSHKMESAPTDGLPVKDKSAKSCDRNICFIKLITSYIDKIIKNTFVQHNVPTSRIGIFIIY